MDRTIITAAIGTPRAEYLSALEQGKVLHFPTLPFATSTEEQRWLDPALVATARKNLSLSPTTGILDGIEPEHPAYPVLQGLTQRYAQHAAQWAHTLFPAYRAHLRAQPTSLRLHRVETRHSSWRKDDSRLHVDAFPSRPNHGQRILRIFMNIHPHTQPRVWRVGDAFEAVARHFLPRLPRQWPASAWLQHRLRITKNRRSRYDHIMLGLHDAMKADLRYQRECPQQQIDFQPGAGWICFSDQATHAVMSGQFMLEQTFFLPVDAMVEPEHAPLAVLQRLTGQRLI